MRLPKTVWALSLTSFFRDVASEMIGNVLPLFLAQTLGVGTSIIGFVLGLADAVSSLTRLVSGWLSDRWHNRKWLTATGYGLAAVATGALWFAGSWFWVMVMRVLDRLGKGIRTAPRDALIADVTPPAQRGRSFGLHRAMDTAGAFVGLTLALIIVLKLQGNDANLELHTWRTLLIWAIVPSIVATLIVIVGVKEPPASPHKASQTAPTAIKHNRRFLLLMGILMLFTLGNSNDAFLVLRMQAGGASLVQILLTLMGFNAVYSLISSPAGRWSDRVGRGKVLLIGWTLYALVYLGFGITTQLWQWATLYALYGIYNALTDGVTKALIADLVPASSRGTAYGVYNAAVGVTILPASLIAGVLWQKFGVIAPFAWGAACAFGAAVLLWLWLDKGIVQRT